MCIVTEVYVYGCGHKQGVQLVQSCAAGFDYDSRRCHSNYYIIHRAKESFAQYFCSKCYRKCVEDIHRVCVRSLSETCDQGIREGWSQATFIQEIRANLAWETRELAEFERLCDGRAQENADAHNGGSRNDMHLVDLESPGTAYDNSDDEEDEGEHGDIDMDDDESEPSDGNEGVLTPCGISDLGESYPVIESTDDERDDASDESAPRFHSQFSRHDYIRLGEPDDDYEFHIRGLAGRQADLAIDVVEILLDNDG